MPEIVVKLGNRIVNRYRFDKEVLSIGRARDNDIVIENLSVSRNHARIKKDGAQFILTDMNSANGTMVNGQRVTKTPLADNDKLTVGKHTLIFLELEETAFSEEPGEPVAAPAASPRPQRSPRETSKVKRPAPEAPPMVGVLTVIKGRQEGREFRLTEAEEEATVGRSSRNHFRVEDWQVSNRHFSISREGGAHVLRDLGSWRGTLVNGNAAEEKTLADGDEITVGETVLSFRLVDPARLSEPPAPWPVTVPVTDYEAEEISAAADPMQSFDPAIEEEMVHILDESMENGSREAPEDTSNLTGFDDDEFAPFTEEELEALESDDLALDEHEEMESHRDSWELVEEEKKIEAGGEDEDFALVESDDVLRREEEAAVGPEEMATMGSRLDLMEEEDEDGEEESLFGGPVPDVDPAEEPPAAPEASSPAPVEAAPPPPQEMTPELEKEIALWEKAMRNRSRIIRKNAAKELKRLTGRDYDWMSEPSGN